MPLADLGEWRVNYEEHGQGDPVLLVNGLGADHTAWGLQIERSGEHTGWSSSTTPASGQTEGPPGPYTTELFADVAAALLVRTSGSSGPTSWARRWEGRSPSSSRCGIPGLVRSLALHCTWGRADRHLTAIIRSWQVGRSLDAVRRALPADLAVRLHRLVVQRPA